MGAKCNWVERSALFLILREVHSIKGTYPRIRHQMRISRCAALKRIVAENERNGFTFWPNSLVKREDTAPQLGGMQWAVEWVP